MIDYVYNEAHTELYKIYRYMDGAICTGIRLIDIYRLVGNQSFEEFNIEAFWVQKEEQYK